VRLPLDRSQFVTYYVLLGLVSMLTGVWQAPYTAEKIRLGRLSPDLLRPAPVILQPIANNLGEKIIKLPLLLPIVAGVALLFGDDFRPPTDPLAWLLFALSLPAAAAINFLLDYLVGLLAFWRGASSRWLSFRRRSGRCSRRSRSAPRSRSRSRS